MRIRHALVFGAVRAVGGVGKPLAVAPAGKNSIDGIPRDRDHHGHMSTCESHARDDDNDLHDFLIWSVAIASDSPGLEGDEQMYPSTGRR